MGRLSSDFPNAQAVDAALKRANKAEVDVANLTAEMAGKVDYSVYQTETANLQGQIDQIVISASAESVVAPEVAQARVDAYGTSYQTLKARLDADNSAVYSAISNVENNFAIGKNKLDATKNVSGVINNESGDIAETSSYYTSDFIHLSANETVVISPSCRKLLAYNLDRTPIAASYHGDNSPTPLIYSAVSECYIRISYSNANTEQMVEDGTTPTNYEPFKIVIADSIGLGTYQKTEIDSMISPVEEIASSTAETVEEMTYTSNLLDGGEKVTGGYYADKEYISAGYNYYKGIPITSGKTYSLNFTARFISFFNSSREYVSNEANISQFTAAYSGYVYVSTYNTLESSLKMCEGSDIDSVPPLNTYDVANDLIANNVSYNAYAHKTVKPTTVRSGYYSPATGEITADENYCTSELIDISDAIPESTISLKSSLTGYHGVVILSEQGTVLYTLNGNNAEQSGYVVSALMQDITIKLPANAHYVAASYRTAYFTSIDIDMPVDYMRYIRKADTNTVGTNSIVNGAVTSEKIADDAIIPLVSSLGKNIFDPEAITANCVINNAQGWIAEIEGYDTSDFIDISSFSNDVCISPRTRKVLQYDETKTPIEDTYENSGETNNVITIHQNAKYLRFSIWHSDLSRIQVEDNTECTDFVPYAHFLDEEINALNDNTKDSVIELIEDIGIATDRLAGKKWIPFGDSFTDYTNKNYSEGQYTGKSMSYPRLISERTGIIIDQNFFLSGRTMAYPEDHTFDNSATCPTCPGYYQNIPQDADYITIMLGINDVNHTNGSGTTPDGEDATGVITLGTIDDTTTATYYGAYNTVLAWIRENRPFAHVGIIVTNGTQREDYTNAQIAVARKWGYPYLNLNGDERTPAMIRCYNPNMSSALRNTITQIQAVNYPTNTHPNYQAHEYESVFIENWLRTL